MCTINTSKIYLTWRKDVYTKRHIIGILEKKDNDFCFYYIKENTQNAINDDGFTLYNPFVDINEVYTDKVLETFARRLLNPARNDYNDFLNYWGAIQYKEDIFSILGLTGAKLLTDNFEFISPHTELPACFNTDISWLNTKSETLINEIKNSTYENIQKNITFKLEPDNKFDSKAVEVLYKNEHLGYLKSIHCENVFNAIKNDRNISIKVSNIIKNGTIKEILLKIKIDK